MRVCVGMEKRDLGFALCVCVCVGRGRGGGMLGRSVCLNLLLLAEKVMSASVFLECVLFSVFFSYVII